jgi:hypothetical protein
VNNAVKWSDNIASGMNKGVWRTGGIMTEKKSKY